VKNRYVATDRQISYIKSLAADVMPGVAYDDVLKLCGVVASDLCFGLMKHTAHRVIDTLKARKTGTSGTFDPGELAADRWCESQAGL
jgi:hypothetical protein